MELPHASPLRHNDVMKDYDELYAEGIHYVESIKNFRRHQEEQQNAMQRLRQSPYLRNALMGLPLPNSPLIKVVSLDVLLGFHCDLDRGSECTEAESKKRKKTDTNAARNKQRRTRKGAAQAVFADPAVQQYCSLQFPVTVFRALLSNDQFIAELVGEEVIVSGGQIAMRTLFSRMTIIEYKIREPNFDWDMRSKGELGRLWIPTDSHAILCDMERSWQSYFEDTICNSGYLDEIAGVDFPGKCRKERHRDQSMGKGSGNSISLDGKTTMGGFIEWSHGCFSPEYIRYFEKDALPTLTFMGDPLSPCDRYIRCESPHASHGSPLFFQMGTPPKARLIAAKESSKFGDSLLQICNFIEQQRFDYIFKALQSQYGFRTATEFTPCKKRYDLLFGMIGQDSFRYHTDSREMLFDENVAGWEENNLRVVTAFFQNAQVDNVVELRFKSRRDADLSPKSDVEVKFPLGAAGIHEQGYLNQANLLHCAALSKARPPKFRRCVWTARATQPLQTSGLQNLKNSQRSYLPVFGSDPSSYQWNGYNIFFPSDDAGASFPSAIPLATCGHPSEDDNRSYGLGLSPHIATAGPSRENIPDDGTLLRPDFPQLKDATRFRRRPGEYEYYPSRSPTVLLQERTPLVQLLTSKEGLQLLHANRVRLEVEDCQQRAVPFGPCPADADNMPTGPQAQIGSMLSWDSTRRYYGVPTSRDNHAPWNSPSQRLSSLYVFKRYKSPLETQGDMHSAASEAHRILTNIPPKRKGFYVYFSGGNGCEAGSVAPDPNRKELLIEDEPGVAYYSPVDMTLKNSARNMALFEASTSNRVVTVFIGDQNLPRDSRYGEDNRKMCLHAGFYCVHPMEICKAQSPRFIQRSMDACERVNLPGLDPIEVKYLSFLTRVHFRCWLEPITMGTPHNPPNSLVTWKKLTVCQESDDRLASRIPRDFKGCDLVLPTTKNDAVATTRDMLQTYLSSKGFLEDEQDNDQGDAKRVMVGTLKHATRLNPDALIDTLRRLLVGYCMRVLKVNVDDDDQIGYLCDIPEGGDVEATQYRKLFGSGTVRYCASLGLNVQENPYPSPLPSGDPKLVYLQEANMGTYNTYKEARQARSGLEFLRGHKEEAAGMLVQSLVSETLGNPDCNLLWSKEYEKVSNAKHSHPQLPHSTDTCRHYIAFIREVLSHGKGTFQQWQHGHYKLHPKFGDLESFGPILMSVALNAPQFIQEIVDFSDKFHSKGKNVHLLREKLLEKFRSWLISVSHVSCWEPFHLSKIFAAMEELISDQPFGEVGAVPLGFGSKRGQQLVDWEVLREMYMSPSEKEVVSTREVEKDIRHQSKLILQLVSDRLKTTGDDWFGLIYREDTGRVHQSINGRELNAVDVEHWLCKLFLFHEREPHGSRAMAVSSSPQSRHCFPMKSVSFPTLDSIAKAAIDMFKIERRYQGQNFFPYSEERARLANTSNIILSPWSNHSKRGGGVIYINEQAQRRVAPSLVPIHHEYTRKTFVNEEATRSNTRIEVLEDAEFGLSGDGVSTYAELLESCPSKDALPMVAAVQSLESSLGEEGLCLSDTFTLHAQVEANASVLTTFDYHIDKRREKEGPVMALPIEGECFFVLGSCADCLQLRDDSSLEFSYWKAGLCQEEKDQVDTFLEGFKKYSAAQGQPYINIYKLMPGTAMFFRSSKLVHGTIVPKQEEGKTRKMLLFHVLNLRQW